MPMLCQAVILVILNFGEVASQVLCICRKLDLLERKERLARKAGGRHKECLLPRLAQDLFACPRPRQLTLSKKLDIASHNGARVSLSICLTMHTTVYCKRCCG